MGTYRIIDQIGEGGMGSVWRAEHTTIGRHAAVKLLHGEYSGRQEIVQRFFNEARAATQISDPGIVQVFDFGTTPEGRAYIVMELLDGEALDRRLQRVGKLSVHDALRIMRQVASTLGAAHARGIVHRDLKPENVFMVRDPEVPGGERAKILDFGIAKLGDNAGIKTQTNALMGTPQYMSPEQCRGSGGVDARSDVYALGCMMTTLITGAPPFTAEGPGELIILHVQQPAPTLGSRVPHVLPAVDAVAMRCLAKHPDERYASAAELAHALAALITSASQPPGPGVPAALAPHQQPTIALPGDKSPTTLTGAAAQTGGTMATRPRGKALAIAIGGVIAAAAIAVTIAAISGGSPNPSGAAPAPTQVAAVQPPRPVVPVDAARAAPIDAAPAVAPDAAPVKVAITIDSNPKGAQLFVGDEQEPRGATPYVLELDKGSPPVHVKLVARGYLPTKATVTPVQDMKLGLTLDKVRAIQRAHATASSPSPPSSSDVDDTMNPFARKK